MQALIQNSNTFLKFAHFIDQMRMNSLISIEFGGETEYTKAVAWFTIRKGLILALRHLLQGSLQCTALQN